MNLTARLVVMNFLQFFVWGAWLLTLGAYWFNNKHWSGAHFGAAFSTMGIAAIITPPIMGVIADKWINAEKLYGVMHLGGAAALFSLPLVASPTIFFWVLLLNMLCYMPSLSLAITVAYNALKNAGRDTVTSFPPIRVWGTVGFIAALHTVSLLGLETSTGQFYVAGTAALLLGLYAFTLPPCRPKLSSSASSGPGRTTVADRFGLTAFTLFQQRKLAVFFIFAMLLGGALQLTNAYGDTFLHDFADVAEYRNLFAVEHPAIIMSISQISETLFILAIPFFLRRFGIKTVMLMSMVAWTLRFGLFAYGDPGDGLWMIVLSCIVYGMAFDFFNVSGSLFVEDQCGPEIRASAQGLFMLMTNGLGAMLGSLISGGVIEYFFTYSDDGKDWHGIWLSFAGYALVITVAFFILFRPEPGGNTDEKAPATVGV
ncbi:Xanthosine permease [Mycobacteroides abscessus subsp. bolletii]|uniref:nucleoside permease n=2 Tax=Mycobacteroides abscessus TaxID=36809 RepID=UPI000516F94A|nr:nucleoside permease [Mycobacteroides abscessus]UEA48232.1 nucleoside permease [Mycobacteroides abscessus subsp. abscessus]ORA28549.1 MFS transporter [Mycobacteroides abscessus subsp. bolletii]TPF67479.1 nucleoside permease [Mycobacteroides abscessus subsp. bolletii]UEA51788.1 nucleoside permease [Mycobacteroides abscessus]SHT76826.1 transport of nucleoside, permease protein [Mycobacteroides abscessus subsp. bolletii]